MTGVFKWGRLTMNAYEVVPVRAFSDNYVWTLTYQPGGVWLSAENVPEPPLLLLALAFLPLLRKRR